MWVMHSQGERARKLTKNKRNWYYLAQPQLINQKVPLIEL